MSLNLTDRRKISILQASLYDLILSSLPSPPPYIEMPIRKKRNICDCFTKVPMVTAGPIYFRRTSRTFPLASACHSDYTYLPSADAVAQIREF